MSKEVATGLPSQGRKRKNDKQDGLLQHRRTDGTSRCPLYYSVSRPVQPPIVHHGRTQPPIVHHGVGDRGIMYKQIPENGRLFKDLGLYLSGTCRALLNEYELYISGKKFDRGVTVDFPNVLDDADLCLHGRIDFSSDDGRTTLLDIKELLLRVFEDAGSRSYIQEYFKSLYADKNLMGLWVTRISANNKITALVLFTLPPKDQKFFFIHWWSTDREDGSKGLGATILKLVCGLQMQMHNDINLVVFADKDSESLLNHYKRGGFKVPPKNNEQVQAYIAKIYAEEYGDSPFLTPLILQGKFFQDNRKMSSEEMMTILQNYGNEQFSKLVIMPNLI
jgi:hypothetical protein